MILNYNDFILNEGWKENLLGFILMIGGLNASNAQHININQSNEKILDSLEFKELNNDIIKYMDKYKNLLKLDSLDYQTYINYKDKNQFWLGVKFNSLDNNITSSNYKLIVNKLNNNNSYFSNKIKRFGII